MYGYEHKSTIEAKPDALSQLLSRFSNWLEKKWGIIKDYDYDKTGFGMSQHTIEKILKVPTGVSMS